MITVDTASDLWTITLRRPEKANSLTRERLGTDALGATPDHVAAIKGLVP